MVGEGLDGGHHYRLAGVNPHGVHVLHIADGDAGIIAIPHHLILQLRPAPHALFEEHLADPGPFQPQVADLQELLPGLGYASSRTAQCICGPDHQGQTKLLHNLQSLIQSVDRPALWHRLAHLLHGLLEQVPVLSLLNGFD